MPKRSDLPPGYKLVRQRREPSHWNVVVGKYLRQGYPMADAVALARQEMHGGAVRRSSKRSKRY